MKKEVILAILIGLGMGLFITYGIYRLRTSISNPQVTDLEEATSPSPATTADPALIAIHNPAHGSIQTEKTTTVTGTTTPNSHIVLFVNNTHYISTSDQTGNFSFEVTLTEGANIITIHMLDESGNKAVDERVVVVSSELEELEADTTATETAETTSEENKQ
jgi:hypothetical protein